MTVAQTYRPLKLLDFRLGIIVDRSTGDVCPTAVIRGQHVYFYDAK